MGLDSKTPSVVLIGFMATGKSSVGAALAKALECRFIDTDVLVEDAEKMSIHDIFLQKGEKAFREFERREVSKLRTLVGNDRCVIATGGGTVIDSGNMEKLKMLGQVVCLQATLDAILARSKSVSNVTRPLLSATEDERVAIENLLENRKAYYEDADFCVDTSDHKTEEVVSMIVRQLNCPGKFSEAVSLTRL